ncbi:ABC transporter ATP-binding protein [Plantactinospora soyae]|uniref:ABC transport system ATP-binding protein n=1 Tax=Plantactinospora soyae TaxID=1544732 RepID=A0A927R1R9_9ACTN|nr:ABC transporter ATP-binding protein [Plantactinospora soyae]MBE1490018.1 putative ABC transport system ATP-binding protein [Plantactinospora soyae]
MTTGSPSARTVLVGAITGQTRHVAASAALSAGHQAGEALIPVLIGVVIDRAVGRGGIADLIGWIGVLAGMFAVLSVSFRLSARTGERAVEQAAHQLRIALTRRILDHRGGSEAGQLPGALVSIATGDADRVGTVNRALPVGIGALTGLLVGGAALLVVSVPLGLLVLIGAPLLLWLAHLLGRPLERRSHAEQERAAYASGVAADLVAGLRVLKGLGAAPAAANRYRRTSQDSLAATIRAARAQAWYDGTILAVTGLFVAAVGLLGGRLAAQGELTVGQLVAAVGLALFLLGPLSTFGWVNAEFAQGRASAARIASVLGAPQATPDGTGRPATPVRGRIDLRDVRSGTLRGVSLHSAPGELLGIVATDPAVAADLLRCLGRDVDPDTGTVELDGVALHTLDPAHLRAAILVAPHDADLFEGSVLDNVGAAAPAGGDVTRPMAAADVDELVRTLPQGVDTPLAERGRSLSGGQRQRVALARALAAEAPVLVLHDPTTAVDAATEARIAAGLRSLRQDRTTLLVTTSPALLSITDRVVLVDEGTVRAEGSHPDLVRDHADYRASVLT